MYVLKNLKKKTGKEARRKELKKNKKQRLIVRQAVIKQKDPKIIFAEMEAIDKMEYDTNNPPPYSVKVLQDKRRKLKETWLKIYEYYVRACVLTFRYALWLYNSETFF